MKPLRILKSLLPALILSGAWLASPLSAQVTPGANSTGTMKSPPSGNYPGTGSGAQPGVAPAPIAPSPPTPGASQTGTTNAAPSGNYPGTGSGLQPGMVTPPVAPSGATPGSGQGGLTNTPPSGVTPGTGASPNPAPKGPTSSIETPNTDSAGNPTQGTTVKP